MFKLCLYLNFNKSSSNELKLSPLLSCYILKKLSDLKIKQQLKIKKTKTIILSPFHYKTSKKNIYNVINEFKCELTLNKKMNVYKTIFFIKNFQQLNFNTSDLSISKINISFNY